MCYDISYTVKVKELADYFLELIFHAQLDPNFDGGVHIMGHSYGSHPILYRTQRVNCFAGLWSGVASLFMLTRRSYF